MHNLYGFFTNTSYKCFRARFIVMQIALIAGALLYLSGTALLAHKPKSITVTLDMQNDYILPSHITFAAQEMKDLYLQGYQAGWLDAAKEHSYAFSTNGYSEHFRIPHCGHAPKAYSDGYSDGVSAASLQLLKKAYKEAKACNLR